MLHQEWLTANQLKFMDAFQRAQSENCVVSVVDHPGTGFKYSLGRFSFLKSDVKSVLVKIPRGSGASREIAIEMFKKMMTLRFNNFKYTQVTVFDLIRVLGQRVRQDLKGKKILLVFEDVDNLTMMQLARFIRMVKLINFPCGIVLRFKATYFKKVASWDEKLSNEFYLFTSLRKVSNVNSPDDMYQFCRWYGLTDKIFIERIIKETTSFTIAKRAIESKKKYNATSQLNLFEDNYTRQ